MIHTPLTMSVDTDAPQVQIVLSENTLRKVLNKITFGLFFKDTVTAKINSSDEVILHLRAGRYPGGRRANSKGKSQREEENRYDEDEYWKT